MLRDAELAVIDSVWGHAGAFRLRSSFSITCLHTELFS